MIRLPGLTAMRSQRARQSAILAVLTLTIVALLTARFLRQPPAAASAAPGREDSRPADDRMQANDPTLSQGASSILVIDWPMELRRDLFAWEDLLAPTSDGGTSEIDATRRHATKVIDLQAIILGDMPQAVINGRLRRTGETVEGFRIVRIERRRIVVERNGIDVEIDL